MVRLHSSVAVKVTVAEPVMPQSSLKAIKLLVQVTPAQLSEAAPVTPIEANQSLISVVFPLPSHSTVKSEASTSIVGGVASSMVKVASNSIKLLLSSVSLNVTISEPVMPQSSLKPLLSFVITQLGQLSIPVKVLFNQLSNSVTFPAPSHSTVKSVGAFTQVGSSLSSTITLKLQVAVNPELSLTKNVLVVVPTGKMSPEFNPDV